MNLKINHRTAKPVDVKYFSGLQVSHKFDSVASTFSFNFKYDETNRDQIELACVSHFHEVIVEHDGETLLTGYLLSQVFNDSKKTELVQFAGYSKPGVFENCEIPPDLYPLQSDGLTIRQIAQKIVSYFKIKMIVDSSVGGKMDVAIPTTTSKETQNIKSYLTELCKQRGIIVSHNVLGDLVFTVASTSKKPIFHVEQGLIATDISLTFNGESMHSHITVMKEADDSGGNAGQYTIANPYVPIVYRPRVMTSSSGDDITIEDCAKIALAAELKTGVVLKITTDRWKVNGKVILSNNIITVISPKNFIFKKTEFFIEQVDFSGDAKKEIATLTCVLPEVYNGKTPKNIFVDPHKNLPRI